MNGLMYKKNEWLQNENSYAISGIFFIMYKVIFEIAYIIVHNIYYVNESAVYGLEFNAFKYLFSYIILYICITFLPKRLNKFSSLISNLLLCFIMIPILSVYALNDQSTICTLMLSFGFIIQCLIITHATDMKLKKIVNANGLVYVVLYGIIAILFSYFLVTKGLPTFTAFNINNVYDLRSTIDLNKYIAYLFALQIYVVGPFLICDSLNKKKYINLIIISIIQTCFYLWTGHKVIIFYMATVVMIYIISKIKRTEKIIIITLFMIIILCISYALLASLNKSLNLPLSLLVRRAMILPAQLKFDYFDFFSSYPKLGLTGIFPTWIVDIQNPYPSVGFTYLIGDLYYHSPQMNANTGYFIEGFARFGYMGAYIVFILMGFIIKLFDAFVEKVGQTIIYPLCLYFFLAFNDGFLIDELFIKGKIFFMVMILILFDFKQNRNFLKEKEKNKCQMYSQYQI